MGENPGTSFSVFSEAGERFEETFLYSERVLSLSRSNTLKFA